MSFAKVYSAQGTFLKARIVAVEVDLGRGLHSFSLVGLADKAVEEARDRISAAIKNSGFVSPKQKNQKIVVSLAPADMRKEGPHFDLAIAMGYLKAAGDVVFEDEKRIFLGELSLNGKIRKVRGLLAFLIEAEQKGFTEAFIPKENNEEASLIRNIRLYAVENLLEVVEHFQKKKIMHPQASRPDQIRSNVRDHMSEDEDFRDIRGQENAKRALEIAAAGRHNIILCGPPGTGKTMLAKAFRHILPPLSYDEILEVTAIHSTAGILSTPFVSLPPIRSPHHTSSASAIIGGGSALHPGEITLAHRGVLFLDEFLEFDRRVIESLRQPLEENKISLARTKGAADFPADLILLATMNPCPCGNYGSAEKLCICSQPSLHAYRKKISGPIADRIDLWVTVDEQRSRQKKIDFGERDAGESTGAVGARILRAREIQEKRFTEYLSKNPSENPLRLSTNSRMTSKQTEILVPLDKRPAAMLVRAANSLMLSTRVYYKIIKIARTIADLDGQQQVNEKHLLEALQYRPRES